MNYKYLFLSLILLCITMSGYPTPPDRLEFSFGKKVEYSDSLVYEKGNFEILTRRIDYALMAYTSGYIESFESHIIHSSAILIPILTYDKEADRKRWISNDEVKTIPMDSLRSIEIILDNRRLSSGVSGLNGIIEVEFKGGGR